MYTFYYSPGAEEQCEFVFYTDIHFVDKVSITYLYI